MPTHQMINEDLRFCTAVTNSAPGQSKTGARAQRLDRPEIDEDASDEDWRRFLAAWERYKVSCQLTGKEASIQLYQCCTAELQKTLDGLGIDTECSEVNLTAKIKEAAVRKQNILINTIQFLNTKGDGHPVRKHAAKLNRKAVDCEFKLSNKMVRQIFLKRWYSFSWSMDLKSPTFKNNEQQVDFAPWRNLLEHGAQW